MTASVHVSPRESAAFEPAGTGAAAQYRADRLEDRYALALYDLADSKGQVDAVLADVKALAVALESSLELKSVLANPTMARDEQANVLAKIAGKIGAQKLTLDFLALVARKRRQSVLGAILGAYQSEVSRRRGELLATVTSAAPLSDAQQSMLSKALSRQHGNATVTLDIKTDASLIGGFTVRIGSRFYDRTVSGQLQRLQQKLSSAA